MVSSTSATLSRAGPPCVLGEVSVSHLSLSSVPWDIFTQATCLSSSWCWFSGWHRIFSFPVWRFLICSVFFCHKSIYIKKLKDTKPVAVKLLSALLLPWKKPLEHHKVLANSAVVEIFTQVFISLVSRVLDTEQPPRGALEQFSLHCWFVPVFSCHYLYQRMISNIWD